MRVVRDDPTENIRVRPARRGSTLVEVSVSLGLLAAAFGILLPLLHSARRTQSGIERQRLAQAEVANLLERLAQRPYDRLSADAARELKISEAARRELPQAELSAEVLDQPGEVPGKRLSVELRWQPAPGQKSPPCRLVTWVYPPTETKP